MTNQLKALIIEDSPELNLLFSEALNESGFITESIYDGQEAQLRLQTIEPALILLDLHLPQVSGADLLTQIRQDPRLKDCIVIVASADGTWTSILSEQADYMMNKPISYIQLRDLCSRIYKNLTRE
jgi:two-component system, OmpR family, alkaline phosphatase synthesis response regulator PhoP